MLTQICVTSTHLSKGFMRQKIAQGLRVYQIQCQETPIKAQKCFLHRGHLMDSVINILYQCIHACKKNMNRSIHINITIKYFCRGYCESHFWSSYHREKKNSIKLFKYVSKVYRCDHMASLDHSELTVSLSLVSFQSDDVIDWRHQP